MNLSGAFDRVHHAAKLGQDTVTGGIDETPAMILDETVYDLAIGRQGAESRLFIFPIRRL